MQKQIVVYIENVLSQYLCGYRRSFSANQALKSGKRSLITNFMLMDLFEAFDTINHDL